MTTQINFAELQKLIESNPNLLTLLQKNKQEEVIAPPLKPKVRKIKEGMTLEIEEPVSVPTEIVKEITPAQARKLQKKMLGVEGKRTRNITEEQKAVLLENLAKGRERLKMVQEEKRKLKEQQQFKPKEPETLKFPAKTVDNSDKTPIVVKKYIVKEKERKPRETEIRGKKTFTKAPDSESEDESDSGFETDKIMAHIDNDSTTSDSDAKIIRKIKKKVASIKKADKIIKKQQPVVPKSAFILNPFYS